MRKLLVLLAAFALVGAFTVPATAGDVSLSGTSEMNLWFDSDSKEFSGTGYDDADFFLDQDTNSNLSAAFKNEAVGGKVEMRYGAGGGTVRHWYGTWEMGLGTLVIGQTGVPTDVGADGPKRGGGTAYGNFDASRQPQIALWRGGLKVALIKPYTGEDVITRADTDTSLPTIEASYDLTVGPVGLTLFGGTQTYDEVNAADKTYSISSTAFGALGKFAAGPATIKATFWTATNPAEGYHGNGEFNAYYDAASDSVKDASATGIALSVGYKASDTLSFTAGYGQTSSELDRSGTWEDGRSMFFINMPIALAEGVSLTPEIGSKDDMERKEAGVTTKEGSTTWFGAEFKISF